MSASCSSYASSDVSTNRSALLRDDYQAAIQQSAVLALKSVRDIHRLESYASPDFAMQNARWVEDGIEKILCEKNSADRPIQLILETVAVLWKSHLMPFTDRRDMFPNGGDFSPPGHQWVALAGFGLRTHELSKDALGTLHIMGGFNCPEGALKPLLNVEIDGESVMCASLPLCTPRTILRSDSEEVKLKRSEDPNGVVATFASKRNAVITSDNLVHITVADCTDDATPLKFLSCSGALVRSGQVVKAELGFRIVEKDAKYTMRVDLIGLSIVNEDIPKAIAFSNHINHSSTQHHRIEVHSMGPSNILKRPRQKAADRHVKKFKYTEECQGEDSEMLQDLTNLPFNSTNRDAV